MFDQRSRLYSLTVALTLPVIALTACGDTAKDTDTAMSTPEETTPATETAATVSDAEAKTMLETALQNMQQVQSYHAVADLRVGEQTAHVDGDLGIGKVNFTIDRFDGQQTKNIVVDGNAYVSTDGGATWQKDEAGSGALMSQMITSPIDPQMKMTEQGAVKVIGSEEVEGVPTTHVQVQAATPIDVWIADDPQLGKVVRKLHVVITANDGDFDTTVLYGDYNKPMDVTAPM